LNANFRQNGAPPTNRCWCLKTRVIAFRAVLKYPQCTKHFRHKARVWQRDGRREKRTDRRTDGWTDGQNYDSQERSTIVASRDKTVEHTFVIKQLSQLRFYCYFYYICTQLRFGELKIKHYDDADDDDDDDDDDEFVCKLSVMCTSVWQKLWRLSLS